MTDLVTRIRDACARVAERARYVSIDRAAIAGYAATLPDGGPALDESALQDRPREELAAFWLTLDAINFGSGWFPTFSKRAGHSGYDTVAAGVAKRFMTAGPWTADELARIDRTQIAVTLGQRPDHELMELFASSLRDLGRHVAAEHGGEFANLVDAADASAVALATLLSSWDSFADVSGYDGFEVPFYKRAQIAAADLSRAGVAQLTDLRRLTMFADNLVPHVLRIDGILRLQPELAERIEREQLLEHGSPEEVEIRACAVHAVELIVVERPASNAAEVDQVLWNRGRLPRYKSEPRHRARCTAY